MNNKQKWMIGGAVVGVVLVGWFLFGRNAAKRALIQVNQPKAAPEVVDESKSANTGNVSPISGVACDNWNKRAIAVMQPADVSARPAAGFSEADMVFEMPVFTAANTRLMGVYLCNIPADIGSMRSARHDYLPLAKSLDAIFIHWGYSKFAETLLSQKIIDNIDCLTTSFCPRWPKTGKMKLDD